MPSGFNLGDRVMPKGNYNTQVSGVCTTAARLDNPPAVGRFHGIYQRKCETNPFRIESPCFPVGCGEITNPTEPSQSKAAAGEALAAGCARAGLDASVWRREKCFCRKHAYLRSL